MSRLLLTLFLFLSFVLPLFAQSVDTAWVIRYNGPGDSTGLAHAVAVDGSGNVYVTGESEGGGRIYFGYFTIKCVQLLREDANHDKNVKWLI